VRTWDRILVSSSRNCIATPSRDSCGITSLGTGDGVVVDPDSVKVCKRSVARLIALAIPFTAMALDIGDPLGFGTLDRLLRAELKDDPSEKRAGVLARVLPFDTLEGNELRLVRDDWGWRPGSETM
jgi:hypothetical protein